ncbi:MAG: prepilin-type N-terminal cleavage/methylation domain-containing protein, partial [Planctomycetales bacterium]|nr:prepilin-type N-terminal cleavage/methylation domain-containing protein [Planctomycetales bacterium]
MIIAGFSCPWGSVSPRSRRPYDPARAARPAFTLVELLVVIAIIAIL